MESELPTKVQTDSQVPDYDALAREVVRLMAQMRPPHPPFPEDAGLGDSEAAAGEGGDGIPHPPFPVPAPPAIPTDLMEVGRGSVGVLGALSQLGGQATPKELGQLTGLSKGRISNIIRRLEEKGYVEKSPSPIDSRSVTVVLSAKGHQVTDQHISTLRAHVATMLRLLGPRDAEDGVRVMRHLAQIIGEKCTPAANGRERGFAVRGVQSGEPVREVAR